MSRDPAAPIHPTLTSRELGLLADRIERWGSAGISPDLANYYRERAAVYRVEAVRRIFREVTK